MVQMKLTTKYGIEIPVLGLGTFSMFGDILNSSIKMAVQSDISLIDTAYKYKNERDISEAISHIERERIFLQSKVCYAQLKGRLSRLYLDKQSVARAYKQSCRQLNVERLDAYLLHSYFDGCEKHYKELIRLREKGDVSIIGICNANISQLERIYNSTKEYPMILQAEIHLFNSQKPLIEFCKSHNIIIEARSPFAHGDAMSEWMNHGTLQRIAEKHDKTIPQIILKWLIQQNIIVVFRSSDLQHIRSNSSIFDFMLSKEDMKAMDDLNQDKSYGFISQKQIIKV